MDGTLVKYEETLNFKLAEMASEQEINDGTYNDERIPYIKARQAAIKRVPGFWYNLPIYETNLNLMHAMVGLGFDVSILTKGPYKNSLAWKEKVDFIHDKIGSNISIDIVGETKSKVYGSVLFDDYPDYVSGWLEHRPRGLAILPFKEYNKDFRHPNAIHYTGTPNSLEYVISHLKAVANRKRKQHWKEVL